MNQREHNTTTDDLPKLERRTLAERIADKLRDLVLLEKLAPGTPITERDMANALGVSRTPLRESLRILASEGLVEIEANRAPRVANPSLLELKELLQVQGALEALAGELACEAADDTQIKSIVTLETAMRKQSNKSEALAFFQMDMQFHEAIVSASGNQALVETHKNYNARLWRARFISSRERVNRAGTLQQHQDIVDALKNRQRSKCAKALRAHLQSGYQNIAKAQQGEST